MKMKKNMISLCALLLVGAASMMTTGALGADKPTLAVFVVGIDNGTLDNTLATQMASGLNRYAALPSNNPAVQAKLTELRKQGVGSIDKTALVKWGRTNGVAAICLVTDVITGSDHIFYAQLIDTKNATLSAKGSYFFTNVSSAVLPRVSSALSQQLNGPERRHVAYTRTYPAALDIEMVFVEGGAFNMGCQDNDCYSDKRDLPVHTVTVSSFNIGKYEVTREQWVIVMTGTDLATLGGYKTDDQLPIESVSYDDITGTNGFIKRLNALTGKNYRLPTEAEWEYAARGGKHNSPYKYSGGDDINVNEIAWHAQNSGTPRAVGTKKPNALGIYDMTGNVWEWCSDCYGAYSATQTAPNPTGPTCADATSNHVIRGGGAANALSEKWHRIASRHTWPPSGRDNRIGLRLVLPAQ
jgi:formylglycine-generating enzyme required for sulfatase activity